ncbi:hypothetical protein PR202_ga23328 [Eleusine coracana subsp. coracana]|uniref:RNA helicase n=1 Tax=Eleusine coracana subsp. coracana TaxID=191504 RepID=A0AAV5D680_ELECO|nr:hypothetical protein PR202_ga23328 [Eleusine coracana subsp. coracana]
MASSTATASKGPRYAEPDPSLPKPWRALIDGNTGYMYFWNPETKAVQYERPAPAAPAPAPAPHVSSSQSLPPGYGRPEDRARSSAPSEPRAEAGASYSQNVTRVDDRPRMNHPESRPASGLNLAQSAPPTGQVSQAGNGSHMSPEAYRAKHEITIIGNEAPAPFSTFHSTGFPSEMLREFQQAGFAAPTPIQAQSWPIALKGRDIVAVAKTGSGKTLGYLLPGFMLLKRLQQNSREGPTVLVLSPTRELATQIQDEAIKFGRSSRISSAHVEVISHGEKSRRLEQILRSQEPGSKIIIFCSTKRMCDQLARNLSRQYGAAAIHGDKSQPERDSVLSDFRSGRCPVLVATDVAARGLDVKDIRIVVNYDFPTGVEDYVHRIGRTGRAGATGSAYTFFGDQDAKYASDLVKILEGAGQSVPAQLKEMALRGGYGGRSRRWASTDDSYGGQGYGSGYAKRSTDNFNNSSFGNQAGFGSSFHSSFDNSSRNNQTGSNAGFDLSTNNDQSGGGLSFHARMYDDSILNSTGRFYGSGARDQSRSNNDGFRARSRSPPSKAVGVSNW